MAPKQVEESIPLSKFLEAVAPTKLLTISDLRGKAIYNAPGSYYVATPEITLYCGSKACEGLRIFAAASEVKIKQGGEAHAFIHYRCKNCSETMKTFALWLSFDVEGITGSAYKFGEVPAFGPPTPARVISLIGPQKDLFLKGRRSENQGLGIAAFAYYRRVVEDQKDRLFEEIIRVCKRLSIAEPLISELMSAKKEVQFGKAVQSVKHGLPQALLVNGHNPLTLLHSALSKGLHAQTDDECLELATSIRLVLADFVERVGQVLKDEVELSSAVSRLMRKSSVNASETPEDNKVLKAAKQ